MHLAGQARNAVSPRHAEILPMAIAPVNEISSGWPSWFPHLSALVDRIYLCTDPRANSVNITWFHRDVDATQPLNDKVKWGHQRWPHSVHGKKRFITFTKKESLLHIYCVERIYCVLIKKKRSVLLLNLVYMWTNNTVFSVHMLFNATRGNCRDVFTSKSDTILKTYFYAMKKFAKFLLSSLLSSCCLFIITEILIRTREKKINSKSVRAIYTIMFHNFALSFKLSFSVTNLSK